jgi:mRNA capping enzyme, beta chain
MQRAGGVRYDPFAPEDVDPSVAGATSRLKAQHEKNILAQHLHSLEWQAATNAGQGEASTRHAKRPRPSMPASAPAAHAPSMNGASGSASADATTGRRGSERPRVVERVVEKVVERVVEKVVTVPAEEHITILGVPPLVDDRVRNLVNFILQHVTEPGIEVEAKLGTLFQKYEDVRATTFVPVLCETPLRPELSTDTRFESAVHHTFFAHLNAELNSRVEATAAGQDPATRVQYLRTRELDLFWPGKVRETRRINRDPVSGAETHELIRVQRKTRLGDLNFVCPFSLLDVRYSASKEATMPLPNNGNGDDPPRRRVKERISYKFEFLSVDITAVETTDPEAGLFNHPTHEIEVEIDPSANLFGEVQKYQAGDPSSQLFRIATSLVNTVRLLLEEVHKAAANEEQQQLQYGQQVPHHQDGLPQQQHVDAAQLQYGQPQMRGSAYQHPQHARY